ncbi:MAG: protein kinase [Verrucomicrobia bacterium]|nr:protein kinase [Verrucomicrobiota bacterium]
MHRLDPYWMPFGLVAAAGAAYTLTSRYFQKPKNPFPFHTDKLPPLHRDNEKLWLEKTGLTSNETAQLDTYIAARLHRWKWSLWTKAWVQKNLVDYLGIRGFWQERVLRIPKEESGLPRTLHIYYEYGRLCVQVLCKTKNNLPPVGKGAYKQGKIAVEWQTKTLWVEHIPLETRENFFIYLSLKTQELFDGVRGIFPSPKGRIDYISKKKLKKYSFLSPLRTGDLFIHWNIALAHRLSLASDFAHALRALEQKNVAHRDLRSPNILLHEDTGQVHFEVSDFDKAVEVENLRELREKSDWKVEPKEHSPEDYARRDIRSAKQLLQNLFKGAAAPAEKQFLEALQTAQTAHQIFEQTEKLTNSKLREQLSSTLRF